MLGKYLKENHVNKSQFCAKIGISRPTLDKLLEGESKDIYYSTAMRIYNLTKLVPHQYIPGYEDFREEPKMNFPEMNANYTLPAG